MENAGATEGTTAPPPLTFGYLYDFRNPEQWHRPWEAIYEETLDVVAWTESVGFCGAWVPEHHGADDGYMPTPHLALAAISARTKHIRLGAAVAIAPLYHPVRFAEECAVLDLLSNGRLETAVGIGYRRREYEMNGEAFGRRGSRFDEFLDIVCALWTGETVNFTGRHYALQNARIVPPPPRRKIPLYIGGFVEKAMQRAVKYADGYFGNEELWDLYFETAAQAGRDPAGIAIRVPGLFLTVAEDPERAMNELSPYYHHVYRCYSNWMNEDNALGMDGSMDPMDLDAFKQSGILQILTPDDAVTYFKALKERMRIDHFMMMRPPGLPAARFIEYAQLFADRVIPSVR
ncbi:F420-dependent methylene-tetrahydromethanopterin reductase [Mycolicibacterium flavescens]|uniref:LLM class flavin-dependent oxidoreductase n=1 Tax=Mycobacterium neumannii TaxID=2048551 RepID=UPI000B93A2A3|nr:LLM class flavin-dependent oxidoreductase [Mycobacterium neumannii]VEG43691.1 F420-dependent methylene-tetrahydromethanopterin reductase [Mycolicibacterium flavescens]